VGKKDEKGKDQPSAQANHRTMVPVKEIYKLKINQSVNNSVLPTDGV
jgi:hypothetical protein